MLQRNNRWPASVLGVMLYTLVFIFAHHFGPPRAGGAWTAGTAAVSAAGHRDGAAAAGQSADRHTVDRAGRDAAGHDVGVAGDADDAQLAAGDGMEPECTILGGCGALLVRLLRIMLAMRTS